jgi:hypothetical protein
MLRVNNFVKVLALSTVMFGAGATVATVALSYLPIVNATPTKVAQGLKQSKGEEVDEKNNLKFRVQNCKRRIKTLICNVLATNLKNENQEISFKANYNVDRKSRVIDVSGNEYIAKLVKIGQTENSGEIITQLIGGIPTKMSFSFEIPSAVTKLAVLEIGYYNPKPSTWNVVQFRDVNISGSQASSPNPANP